MSEKQMVQKQVFNVKPITHGVVALSLAAIVMMSTSGCIVQQWRRAEVVRGVYVEVIHKEPSVDTLNFWVKEVEDGLPITELKERLKKTDDYYEAVVVESFRTYLGRNPEPKAIKLFSDYMRSGRIQPEQLADILKDSPEYKIKEAAKRKQAAQAQQAEGKAADNKQANPATPKQPT